MSDSETVLNAPIISTGFSEQVTHGRIKKASRKDIDIQPVIIIDPVTGRVLDATDFLSKTTATFQYQADATISQANPVSTTLYTVLPTTANVRIYSIAAQITWAVTQPTIEVVMVIDGQTLTFTAATPATATNHVAFIQTEKANASLVLTSTDAYSLYRAFLVEGRSVSVSIRTTWAVTQPTPLVCRVKWAKR